MASRLEAIALRLEAIALGLEAIAIRLKRNSEKGGAAEPTSVGRCSHITVKAF